MDLHCTKTLITRELYYHDKVIYLDYIKSNLTLELYFQKKNDDKLYERLSKRVLNIKLDENNLDLISKNAKGSHILIGGPPCQAYSTIGRSRDPNRKKTDPRHFLFRVYLKLLDKIKPTFFVYENVLGLLSAKSEKGLITKMFVDDLNNLDTPYLFIPKNVNSNQLSFISDYRLKDYAIDISEYGVPQKRKRVIIIGVKKEVYIKNKSIVDELWDNIESHKTENINVKDAIYDLPVLDIKNDKYGNNRSIQNYRKVKRSEFAKKMDSGFGVLNHQSRTHMKSDLERYKYFIENSHSGQKRPSIKTLQINKPSLLPKHKNKSSFIDRFKVQLYDQPSSTITAHISKDGHYYIHPDIRQCRSLTVREVARLQSFPDNFFFEGPRTEQFRQVGNAVPPLFANIIAQELKLILTKINKK